MSSMMTWRSSRTRVQLNIVPCVWRLLRNQVLLGFFWASICSTLQVLSLHAWHSFAQISLWGQQVILAIVLLPRTRVSLGECSDPCYLAHSVGYLIAMGLRLKHYPWNGQGSMTWFALCLFSHTHTHTHIYIYIYVYAHTHIYIYIYISTHTLYIVRLFVRTVETHIRPQFPTAWYSLTFLVVVQSAGSTSWWFAAFLFLSHTLGELRLRRFL